MQSSEQHIYRIYYRRQRQPFEKRSMDIHWVRLKLDFAEHMASVRQQCCNVREPIIMQYNLTYFHEFLALDEFLRWVFSQHIVGWTLTKPISRTTVALSKRRQYIDNWLEWLFQVTFPEVSK